MPLPTSNPSNSWIGNIAKFTDKGLGVSFESSDLLAKSPIERPTKTSNRFFRVQVFYFIVADFAFWGICLDKSEVRMVHLVAH